MSDRQCGRCNADKATRWFTMVDDAPWKNLCEGCHGQIRAAIYAINTELLKLNDEGLLAVARFLKERTNTNG